MKTNTTKCTFCKDLAEVAFYYRSWNRRKCLTVKIPACNFHANDYVFRKLQEMHPDGNTVRI